MYVAFYTRAKALIKKVISLKKMFEKYIKYFLKVVNKYGIKTIGKQHGAEVNIVFFLKNIFKYFLKANFNLFIILILVLNIKPI